MPVRIGGFGGVEGLAAWLRAEAVDAMIDATHPFAARMSEHAVRAAAATGTPLLRIERPAWVPVPGDDWRVVAGMGEAAAALGATPRRVLLTVGQQELAPFRAAPWHRYVIRSIDPPAPEALPPNAEVILEAGPFTEAGERALMRARGIGVLVTKNAGGGATGAKLAAARSLGLPVVMVARPVLPAAERVTDAAAAAAWVVSRPGVGSRSAR